MCLLVVAFRVRGDLPLVVAGNRDEFFARPTAPAGFWNELPDVLAGRDLAAGGTWLGVTRAGRFAAVTNVRDLRHPRVGPRSRGELVARFLGRDEKALAYLSRLAPDFGLYGGFHLLAYDGGTLAHASNAGGEVQVLAPGVHGISNGPLDAAWPKVVKAREAVASLLAREAPPSPEELFAILADDARAPDDQLPDTGVGLAMERILSPAFVRTDGYGTRASTVVLEDAKGEITFVERRFAPAEPPSTSSFGLSIVRS